jgi:hypothetical protein
MLSFTDIAAREGLQQLFRILPHPMTNPRQIINM